MTQPTLHIRLFGAFELRLGATPVALESVRAVSLLAYVLLRRDISHSRRSVAFQLWPDSSDAQAQTNLRHVLHTLRRSLPEGYLELTGRTLRWNPTAAWTLDVAEFDAALERAKRGNAVAELRTALAQYRAELLEGVYDEWLLPLRDEYRSRYLAALAQLATVLLEQGAYADALGVAERLLHQDPLDEVTWRLLMRLHDRQGDRARALRAYHACVTTLERELGVEPGRETKELYANLLTSEASAPVARAAMTDVLEQAPMVGRETEFARLVTAWERSERGRARCLFLSGEAGSGKTRLVEELVAWASQRGALTAVGRAYAAEGALAYGPVVAWLRTEGLRETCRRLPEDVRHILSRLVPEMAVAGVQPLPETTADDQRRRLYDAFVQALTQPERPVLLVVDDLHWSDRETLGFLHYLVRTVSQSRLLLVMIARSEELDSQPEVVELLHGLRALDRLDELELAPLSLADTLVLAERISGRTIADDEGVSLFATTEGNPLFIVESLRSGWRPGGEHPSLPPRVQAAIESRLGQVSAEARDLAGVAATIGRAFNTDVLRAAAGADEDELVRALDELWRRRIIREQDGDAYDFSHPLILEAAYRSAGPAQRRQRHARVARALERVYAADPQPVSGQIAAQYDRAAQYEQAVVWYGRAADAALRVYAHADAVHALERALALLRAHPQIPQRAERELALLTVLPGPLLGVAGYSSERLTAAQSRALELADALGRDPDPPLLRSLGLSSLSQGDFDAALGYARRLLALGQRSADPVLLVEADYLHGVAAYWAGAFSEARAAFERVEAHFRAELREQHLLRYGQDPSIVCGMRLAHTLWFLGFPQRAARLRDAVLVRAAQGGHRYSYAVAHSFAVLVSIEMRDVASVRRLLAAHPVQYTDIGAQHVQMNLVLFHGFVDVLDGEIDAGIARMQRALTDPQRLMEAPGMRSLYARILLEACRVGQRQELGVAVAKQLVADSHSHLWDSEALRLGAEFRVALGTPTLQVQDDVHQAIEVACRQQARMPLLRAAITQLQFSDAAGRARATELLTDVVATFSDDEQRHPEVQAARALLVAP